jgi:hypothetical protein
VVDLRKLDRLRGEVDLLPYHDDGAIGYLKDEEPAPSS